MSGLTHIDDRINELLTMRIISARMTMENCNRINDEITALRIERVKMVREEGETNVHGQ